MSFFDDEEEKWSEGPIHSLPFKMDDFEKYFFPKTNYERTASAQYLGGNSEIEAIVYSSKTDFRAIKAQNGNNKYKLLIETSEFSEKELQKDFVSLTNRISLKESLEGFQVDSDRELYIYVLDENGYVCSVGKFTVDVYHSIYNHKMTFQYIGEIEQEKTTYNRDQFILKTEDF